MKIYTLKKGNCTSQDLNENSFPLANACYYALIYFQMAVFTKMPGTWRLWSGRDMSSAQQSLPENWRCSKSLSSNAESTWPSLPAVTSDHFMCLEMTLPQTQPCVGKRDSEQLWGAPGEVRAYWRCECRLCWAADVWLHGPFHQQRCGTEHPGAAGSAHPSWASAAGPAPVPGPGQSCPGPVGLLQCPSKSTPDLQSPISQLKRFVSQKFKPLRLFQISLCEGIICFKEVIAVIFDFHQKDILKPGKEIWNEFAVLHLSKCYSHWPSKGKTFCQIIMAIFAF